MANSQNINFDQMKQNKTINYKVQIQSNASALINNFKTMEGKLNDVVKAGDRLVGSQNSSLGVLKQQLDLIKKIEKSVDSTKSNWDKLKGGFDGAKGFVSRTNEFLKAPRSRRESAYEVTVGMYASTEIVPLERAQPKDKNIGYTKQEDDDYEAEKKRTAPQRMEQSKAIMAKKIGENEQFMNNLSVKTGTNYEEIVEIAKEAIAAGLIDPNNFQAEVTALTMAKKGQPSVSASQFAKVRADTTKLHKVEGFANDPLKSYQYLATIDNQAGVTLDEYNSNSSAQMSYLPKTKNGEISQEAQYRMAGMNIAAGRYIPEGAAAATEFATNIRSDASNQRAENLGLLKGTSFKTLSEYLDFTKSKGLTDDQGFEELSNNHIKKKFEKQTEDIEKTQDVNEKAEKQKKLSELQENEKMNIATGMGGNRDSQLTQVTKLILDGKVTDSQNTFKKDMENKTLERNFSVAGGEEFTHANQLGGAYNTLTSEIYNGAVPALKSLEGVLTSVMTENTKLTANVALTTAALGYFVKGAVVKAGLETVSDMASDGGDKKGGKGGKGGKGLGKIPKMVGGVATKTALVSGAIAAIDVYNDDSLTSTEKTKEYVKAGTTTAGGLVGGEAGAMAGAAIGTLILPGIGTLVGGLIGGAAGMMGGSWIGRKAGEQIVGDEKKPDQHDANIKQTEQLAEISQQNQEGMQINQIGDANVLIALNNINNNIFDLPNRMNLNPSGGTLVQQINQKEKRTGAAIAA